MNIIGLLIETMIFLVEYNKNTAKTRNARSVWFVATDKAETWFSENFDELNTSRNYENVSKNEVLMEGY